MKASDIITPTLSPLPRTARVEFASQAWVNAARDYLSHRVAERRDQLRGERFVVCEQYRGTPVHLGFANGVASFHVIVDDGEITVGNGVVEAANFSVKGEYCKGEWVSATVYEGNPARQQRVQRETHHLFGDMYDIALQGKASPAMGAVFAGMHDHMAARTVYANDLEHRIAQFGLGERVRELDENGYTILEKVFSPELTDELEADLRRLIAETQAEYRLDRPGAASMLLARGEIWRDIAVHPLIYTLAQAMVGMDCNLGQSIGFAKAQGRDTHQMHNDPPHPDTSDKCCNLTTIFALTDWNETAGATLVVPGSHKLNCAPDSDAREQARKLIMPRGSVAMWHGSLWHGAAVRDDTGERVSVHNTYLRNWVRTFDNYQFIDQQILQHDNPMITTLCGVDDIYQKNTLMGPDRRRYL